MTWLIFIALAVLALSITNILQRVLMRGEESDVYSYAFVSQITSAAFLFILVLFTGFSLPPLEKVGLNLLLLMVLYGIFNISLFKSFQKLEAGEVVILTSLNSVWAIAAAIVFLHEPFTFLNLIGTLLILGAIILVSLKGKGFTFNRNAIYPMLAAMSFGLAVVNDRYALNYAEPFTYTAIGFLLPAIAIFLVQPQLVKKLPAFKDSKLLLKTTIMSFFYAVSALSFYLAFHYGAPASTATPISRSVVIVTVILGAIFLKERDHLIKKFIAAALVILGVILLK